MTPGDTGAFHVPTSFWRAARPGLWRALIGIALTVGGAVADSGSRWVLILLGTFYLGTAAILLVLGARSQHRPAITIDCQGIAAADGRRLQEWDEAVDVWVGYAHGRWFYGGFRTPSIRVYRTTDLAFARRAATPTRPRVALALPTPLAAEEIARLLRQCTGRPVTVGDPRSLRRFERELTRRPPC